MTDVSNLELRPKDGHCHFYVTRKKRFCRMTVKTGVTYCGEHQLKAEPNDNESKDSNSLQRMVCPLDSTHTCFVSKLNKHLKVCNARPKDLPSFIEKNCNIPNTNEPQYKTEKVPLCNVPTDKLIEIIAIVENIYRDLIENNISNIPTMQSHPSVSAELSDEKRGNNTKRHLQQTSTLLNIIESNNLLNDNTCYAELGAGKGHLSFYLASAIKNVKNSSVLLIDRASHRHKQDNKLDKESFTVNRIRADISDLMVAEIPFVKDSEKVVGVSKHLCGAATDLALRCLTNPNVIEKTCGIVMALCCHHQCQWISYIGRKFLEDNKIGRAEFDIICGFVSWATCGSGFSRYRQLETGLLNPRKKIKLASELPDSKMTLKSNNNGKLENENIDNDKKKEKVDNNSDKNNVKDVEQERNEKKDLGLSFDQKEEIGYKAKAVLDWGRVLFLREMGFKADLYYYVDRIVSPENVCLVATKLK